MLAEGQVAVEVPKTFTHLLSPMPSCVCAGSLFSANLCDRESVGMMGSHAPGALCQQYAKKGGEEGWKKGKVQPQLKMNPAFIHVFYNSLL